MSDFNMTSDVLINIYDEDHRTAESLPATVQELQEDTINAAITWAVKLKYSNSSPAAFRAFERWLQTDPLHALAWQRVGKLRQSFNKMPPELLRTTLDAADARRHQRQQSLHQALKGLPLIRTTVEVD